MSGTDGIPGPGDPAVPSHGTLFDDPADAPPVVPSRATPSDQGRLYRSAGAEGSLAEAAIPALTRAPAPDPSLPLSPEAVAASAGAVGVAGHVATGHVATGHDATGHDELDSDAVAAANQELAAATPVQPFAPEAPEVAGGSSTDDASPESGPPVQASASELPATAWPAASPLAAAAAALVPGSAAPPSTPGPSTPGPSTPAPSTPPGSSTPPPDIAPGPSEPAVVEASVEAPDAGPVPAAEPLAPLVPIVPVISTLPPIASPVSEPAMQAPQEWFAQDSEPAVERESVASTSVADSGLTWTGTAVVVIGVTLVATLIETIFGQHRNGGVAWLTGVALLGSTVYCAIRLRIPDIWAAVIMPPLAYLAALVLAGLLKVGASGSFISRQAINIVTGLALGAPWILGSTLVALVIVVIRRRRARPKPVPAFEPATEDAPLS